MQILEEFELATSSGKPIFVRWFGVVPYQESHAAMMDYATTRSPDDPDQIWLLEHPPVYTQGTACDLNTFIASHIPVVKTDRGGQITYHGPGQIVMYPLLHLKSHSIGVKALVNSLEQCAIDLLAGMGIYAERREDAPGVYVDQAKIAALGLRIRRGNSYHGLSFNVDMDLAPFSNIDPCGYQGLKVARLVDLLDIEETTNRPSEVGLTPCSLDIGKQLATYFTRLI